MSIITMVIVSITLGVIGIENADATVCSGLYNYSRDGKALVGITVNSMELSPDDENMSTFLMEFPSYDVEFTVDKIGVAPDNFSTTDTTMTVFDNSDNLVKVGLQYTAVFRYNTEKDTYEITSHSNCGPSLAPISYIDYQQVRTDLKDNPCDEEKDYLIKFSNFKKICLSTVSRDKLIERHYGFYIPHGSFEEWQQIVENKDTITRYPAGYLDDSGCQPDNVLQRGYCLPYIFSMEVHLKDGNTVLTMSNIPNLNEIVTVTLVNSVPHKSFKWGEDKDSLFRISLDGNLKFVDVEDVIKSDRSEYTHYGKKITFEEKDLFLEAKVMAVREGGAMIHGGLGLSEDDIIRFTISENSVPYWQFTDLQDENLKVSINIDKEKYVYPEPIHVTAEFEGDVGKYIAFLDQRLQPQGHTLSKLVYLDDQNKIDFLIDAEVFEKFGKLDHDKYELVMFKGHDSGRYDIPISYVIDDDESKSFIYWKNEFKHIDSVDKLKQRLFEKAFFNAQEVDKFLNLYPGIGKSKDSTYNEPPPEPSIEDTNVTEQEQPNVYDQEQQRKLFLEFLAEFSDEVIADYITQVGIKEIRDVVEVKQYSEQQLRNILEEETELPKTYIDRLIKKIF